MVKLLLSTKYHILRACPFLFTSKLQNFQALTETDKERTLQLAEHCSAHPDWHPKYLSKMVFSDHWIFRVDGVVNKQIVIILGHRASRWVQRGGHEQSWSFEVVRSIMKTCNRPMFFCKCEYHWWKLQTHAYSLRISTLLATARRLAFLQDRDSPHYSNGAKDY